METDCAQAKGEAVELTEERVLSFAQALLRTVATETAVRTAPVIPSVHFLLGICHDDTPSNKNVTSVI